MWKPTSFTQLAAFVLCVLNLVCLIVIYFVNSEGNNSTAIISCLTGSLGTLIMFFVKTASDAKNTESNNKMIDLLKDKPLGGRSTEPNS